VQAAPSASGVSGFSRAHRPGGAGSARRHLIVDNYSTHSTQGALCVGGKAPIPRHYTPTYSSWLNQSSAGSDSSPTGIRRGSFKSVKDLIAKINRFTRTTTQ